MVFRSSGGPDGDDRASGFLNGMIMQLVNIKLIIYGLTALSVFILPHYTSLPSLSGFVLLLSAMGLAGTTAWAVGGSLLKRLFQNHRRLVNTALALSLVICAVSAF